MVEKGPIHPDGPPQKLHKLHFATSPSSDLVLVISDEGLVVMGRLSRHCIKGYNKVVKRVRAYHCISTYTTLNMHPLCWALGIQRTLYVLPRDIPKKQPGIKQVHSFIEVFIQKRAPKVYVYQLIFSGKNLAMSPS